MDDKKQTVQNRKHLLAGVFPSITTPFVNDKISIKHLKENIERYNRIELGGYMILGGNGEYLGLTEKETMTVVKTIMRCRKPGRTVVAGAGRESATATLAVIRAVAKYGVDVASIITPFYYAKRMTDTNLAEYFEHIADKSPIPIIIYNSPVFAAGLELSETVIKRLSGHENIIGMKNSSLKPMEAYIKEVDENCDFCFHSGKASNFLHDLQQGAVGATLSMAIYAPQLCADLYQSFTAGDMEAAQALNKRVLELNQKGPSQYGVPGVKAALDIIGYFGGDVRLPLKNITGQEKQDLTHIFKIRKKAGR